VTDGGGHGGRQDLDEYGDGAGIEDEELLLPGPAVDVEILLRRVGDTIANARPMPLSASVMINRDEVLGLVDEALDRLPEELRSARYLLKERDEFLAKARREGQEILDAARLQSERMVERTEVAREAKRVARQLVDGAEERARRLRHEAEDFCDQKLAQFEIVLDRTMRTVQAGRSRLQMVALGHDDDTDGRPGVEAGFFDQDRG
jgi:F0F1-type ATP synthase membrane subunit b/b'